LSRRRRQHRRPARGAKRAGDGALAVGGIAVAVADRAGPARTRCRRARRARRCDVLSPFAGTPNEAGTMSIHKHQIAAGGLAVAALAAACTKPPVKSAPNVPVTVVAATQIAAPHTIEANGVVEPLHTVAVEAQVGGTLDSVEFREGEDVQSGQVLFRIDPRPFQTALRQAEATLARDVAQALSARRDADRYQALVAKDYVTKSQADQAMATAAALSATVQADSAAVDNARLNLNYTTIRAPIAGRTGRLLVKQGNLVKANADPLVVINTLHPITVRFPVVQREFPELQRRSMRGTLPVRVVTSDSGRVGDVGRLDFLDNEVDSLTGSVVAKAL